MKRPEYSQSQATAGMRQPVYGPYLRRCRGCGFGTTVPSRLSIALSSPPLPAQNTPVSLQMAAIWSRHCTNMAVRSHLGCCLFPHQLHLPASCNPPASIPACRCPCANWSSLTSCGRTLLSSIKLPFYDRYYGTNLACARNPSSRVVSHWWRYLPPMLICQPKFHPEKWAQPYPIGLSTRWAHGATHNANKHPSSCRSTFTIIRTMEAAPGHGDTGQAMESSFFVFTAPREAFICIPSSTVGVASPL